MKNPSTLRLVDPGYLSEGVAISAAASFACITL